jgi:hypothetical protein
MKKMTENLQMNKSITDTINEEVRELYEAGLIDDAAYLAFLDDENSLDIGDITNLEPSYYRPFGKDKQHDK